MSSEVPTSRTRVSYLKEIVDMAFNSMYSDAISRDEYRKNHDALTRYDIFYECTIVDPSRREELIHDMQELFN